MATKKTDEQKAAEAQAAAELKALQADPIGTADREVPQAEPLGYVDPESQKEPAAKRAAKKTAAVTRADAKGDANA